MQTKVNGYGDAVAEFYRLDKGFSGPTADFVEDAEETAWRKNNAGVYFFDLRRGALGHIGFIVVKESGIRHVQMSMKHEPGPLDKDGFAAYLEDTTYANEGGTVTLYRVMVETRRSTEGK